MPSAPFDPTTSPAKAKVPERIEDLLEEGERLRWRVRPRSLAYLAARPLTLLLYPIVIAAGLWLFMHSDRSIWAAGVIAGFLWLTFPRQAIALLVTKKDTEYAASDRHLFVRGPDGRALSTVGVRCIPLRRVESVDVRRRFVDRVAGTATVVVGYTDDDQEPQKARLPGLANAEDVAQRIRIASPIGIVEGGYRVPDEGKRIRVAASDGDSHDEDEIRAEDRRRRR